MINVSSEEKQIILGILNRYIPDRKVMALGSRVMGTPKPYSDLDLAIMGDTPLDFQTLVLLKDAFAESDLPYRVDILQWCQTSPEFRKTIQPQLQTFRQVS
jgi:predicted nucleotidyltransferase